MQDELKIYKSGNGYIGKLDTSKMNSNKSNNQDLIFIIILDVSGSMGQTVQRFVNIILPNLLQKLDIKNDINLITFSNDVKLYKGDSVYFSKMEINAYGCTYMNNTIDELEKIFSKTKNKTTIRILSVSDGELHDQEETVEKASNLYTKFKDNFIVNSQAVRLYTSSSEPETKGMSSLMQFSNTTEPKLIDIKADKDLFEIADEIANLFKSDGLGCNLFIKSNENIFMENPWSEPINELRLIQGENVFWLSKIPNKVQLCENINNQNSIELKVEICENITIKNYQKILESKIQFFYQKLKVLKVVNTESASMEINKIINYFDSFENILNLENIDNEVNLKESEKYKISNRTYLLKKLIEKRNISISHKMKEIQNNDKVSQLNAKQLADFLRNLDINKEGKSLARRGVKEGIDFDEVARKEALNMLQHIDELNDIDDSSHNVSFYSASTTLDGIKSVCDLAKDKSVLDNVTAIDIIKILNIVGIGAYAPIGDYTDPMTYRLSDIYIGCYVSLSDVLTASEYNGGKDNLVDFSTKKLISNVIPFYDDIRIHKFLIQYAPKLLEYTASIGMRRILIEVPYTYEFLIEAGIWKFSEVLNSNRSEAAINIYTKLIEDYELASKGHYDYLIDIVLDQVKLYKKNPYSERNNYHIYLNDNSVVNMTCVFLSLLRQNETSAIQKMCRELFCHGVHKVVNKLIKKNESKAEFIKKYLEELLGINYEKFGNNIPALFEENLIEKDFYDNYNINIDKLNEFYKISFRSMFVPMTPLYLNATLQQDKKKAFAELPLFNEENVIKALGINFDLNHFKLFALIQGFLFRTNDERLDTKEKIMKIIDIGNYPLAEKMVKDYVKKLYRENYEERLNIQKKTENEILENELIDKMEKADSMEEYVKLVKEGIKRGIRICKLDGISNSVFIKLKKSFIENGEDIPLINKKIAVIITGYYKEEKVFNNGNIYRGFEDFKDIICQTDEEYWNKLYKYIMKKRRHYYREMPNRQGHSNDKPSYWALGYKTIEEMFNTISKVEVDEYKKIHSQCCGLGNKRNRTKNK